MIGYILGRLLSLCFVLLVVSVFVFVLMNLVPGGPFTLGRPRLLRFRAREPRAQVWA